MQFIHDFGAQSIMVQVSRGTDGSIFKSKKLEIYASPLVLHTVRILNVIIHLYDDTCGIS